MNRKRKAYLLASLFLFLVTLAIVSYPIAGFYFTRYTGSNHDVWKGEYTYVFTFPVNIPNTFLTTFFTSVYHFQALGNGRFNFTGILYWGNVGYGVGIDYRKINTDYKHWRRPFVVPPKQPQPKEVMEVHGVLNYSSPLIRLLFPRNGTVDVLGKRALVGWESNGTLTGGSQARFFPGYLGFPRMYYPNGLAGNNLTFHYKYFSDYPVSYVRGRHGYVAFCVCMGISKNATTWGWAKDLEIERFFGPEIGKFLSSKPGVPSFKFNMTSRVLKPYHFNPIGGMLLVQTNFIPSSQDWAWAFKYSFEKYAAPVDYVLILIGLILLVLAGRAKG